MSVFLSALFLRGVLIYMCIPQLYTRCAAEPHVIPIDGVNIFLKAFKQGILNLSVNPFINLVSIILRSGCLGDDEFGTLVVILVEAKYISFREFN